MDFAAPHTGFVVASYAVSLFGLAVLVLTTLMRDRKLAREAAALETRKSRGQRK